METTCSVQLARACNELSRRSGLHLTIMIFNQLGTLEVPSSVSPLLVTSVMLLLPMVVTFAFRSAALRGREGEHAIAWAGFVRPIMAITVACWWVTWDLFGHSEFVPVFIRVLPGAFEASSAEALLFWAPPLASLGISLILCYTGERALLSAMELY